MSTQSEGRIDLIIAGGMVIDGTGDRPEQMDIAISGDRIIAVGDPGDRSAQARIDAVGKVVAPGFIDVHTHDDAALIETPDMEMKISQGVTSVVVGNCGFSTAPFDTARVPDFRLEPIIRGEGLMEQRLGDYMQRVEAAKPSVNAAFLTGHSTLRYDAMGLDVEREATTAEIDRMQRRLSEALADGAIGMSSGLYYPPAAKATTAEVCHVAEPLGAAGGVYTAHMRDEGDDILAAMDEAFLIGRHAGAPVVISHHKCNGRANFGRTAETLPKFREAMRHQRISLDVYPYIAGSTILLPHMIARAERVMITGSKPHPECAGRDLDAIAREWGCTEPEAVERLQPAAAIYFSMSEDDLRQILRFEHAMIGSDGLPGDPHPHPRLWGTFPRVLGHYVRELGLIPLEHAVHRMTGLSATNFGLRDRGHLRAGAFADIVIFDPQTVGDQATFDAPLRRSTGIEHVFVNGRLGFTDGAVSAERRGRVLRREG